MRTPQATVEPAASATGLAREALPGKQVPDWRTWPGNTDFEDRPLHPVTCPLACCSRQRELTNKARTYPSDHLRFGGVALSDAQ